MDPLGLVLDLAAGPLPREAISERPIANVWRAPDGGVAALAYADGDEYIVRWPELASFRFSAKADVVQAFPEQGCSQDALADVWHRAVIPFALVARGYEALHASAVAGSRAVAAFAAPSGTGKSTLAAALVAAGLAHFADDVVVFRATGADPMRALPLPFSPRLKSGSTRAPAVGLPIVPAQSPTKIGVVCVLRRTDRHSGRAVEIAPLTRTNALLGIMEHLHSLAVDNPREQHRHFDAAATLVNEAVVLEVTFRSDLDALPRLVDALSTALAPHL